jgi:hypothetical protein
MAMIAIAIQSQRPTHENLDPQTEHRNTWTAAFGVMIFALTTAYGLTQFSV